LERERWKREQLGANIFDKADEAEVEKELEDEKKEAKKRKDLSKDLKKALIKRERNYVYDSDSDHPYSEKVCNLRTACIDC
jgi:transcription initiation factor TFIIF subunit alpha